MDRYAPKTMIFLGENEMKSKIFRDRISIIMLSKKKPKGAKGHKSIKRDKNIFWKKLFPKYVLEKIAKGWSNNLLHLCVIVEKGD